MEILCPQCSTRFRLSAEQLGPKGRRLRCSKCGHTWHQAPPPEAAAPVAAAAAAPAVTAAAAQKQPAGREAAPAAARAAAAAEAPARPPLRAERPEAAKAAAQAEPAKSAERAPAAKAAEQPKPAKVETPRPSPLTAGAGGARAVPASDLPHEEDLPVRRRVESLRRKRQRGMGRVLLAGWLLFFLVVLGLGLAAWLARDWVVARWPAAVRFYDAVGLEVLESGWGLSLEGIEERYRPAAKGQMLELAGRVVNSSGRERLVPAIRVAILDSGGRILVTEEVAAKDARLQPGAATAFEVSLAMPETGTDYRVSFVGPGGE